MSNRSLFEGIAEVLEAGAKKQRGYIYNTERQQQAEALEAMASKAREIARREGDDGD